MHSQLLQIDAQVASATCQVKHKRTGSKIERADCLTAPADVEAKGHYAVYEVIAGSDRIEHLLHCLGLFGTLGQLVGVP